jgi:hypothetical protein
MKLNTLFALVSLLALSSCGGGDDAECGSPLPVLGTSSALGYIVGTAEDVDPDRLATEYIETYGDDIHVFNTASTFFAAEMTQGVLDVLRCDKRVARIDFRSQGPI